MTESWLLIETSGRVGKIGLARAGTVVHTAELDASRRHARDLSGAVSAILTAEGLRPADLTGVMVSVGPGSYTGLRVGVISAKALAFALDCRLIPVGTFDLIATQAPPSSTKLWVIADALQGQIYVRDYGRESAVPTSEESVCPAPHSGGEGCPKAIGDLRIVAFTDWVAGLGAGEWISGPAVSMYADRLPASCPLVRAESREPTVHGLYRAGQSVLPATREELFRLEPLYLRGSSAEEKAKQEQPRG